MQERDASDNFADESVDRLSASQRTELADVEHKQQMAYDGLESARRAQGVARIVIGLHLATLQDTDGWQGRSGAMSFRRFLLEEGIEPTAAYQYMIVARAFLLEHAVAPERIATVSMRVLVIAARYLRAEDQENGIESNADEVVAIVTSMPAAEGLQRLKELYDLNELAVESAARPKLSTPVLGILNKMEGLTHDGRAELYQALRLVPPGSAPAAGPAANRPPKERVTRIPAVIRPEPPWPTH